MHVNIFILKTVIVNVYKSNITNKSTFCEQIKHLPVKRSPFHVSLTCVSQTLHHIKQSTHILKKFGDKIFPQNCS